MSFTWFDKFTETLNCIPDETDRATLAFAIISYGTYEVDPNLEYPLSAIFTSLKDDIDNSIKSRTKNKGGRPPKNKTAPKTDTCKAPQEQQSDEKTFEEEPENAVDIAANSDKQEKNTQEKTGVSDEKNGGFETENGGFETPKPKPIQTNTSQTNIEKENTKEKRRRFSPPTRDEVAQYASENGLSLDVDKYFDFYESNGWKCGKNPMKDWKAAARRAAREWARIDPGGGGVSATLAQYF